MSPLSACVSGGALVLCLFGLSSLAAAAGHDAGAVAVAGAGDSQCADATAKSVMATLGGRSRVITVLMNFVKCLQRASTEIWKIINDMLADLAGCVAKPDIFDVVKCMMSDAGLKKLSVAVMKAMEVVKCSLE